MLDMWVQFMTAAERQASGDLALAGFQRAGALAAEADCLSWQRHAFAEASDLTWQTRQHDLDQIRLDHLLVADGG